MDVRIKNVTGTEYNDWCLWELKKYAGIKSGDIIENVKFNPKNRSVEFSVGATECVAWIDETCEIIERNGNRENR